MTKPQALLLMGPTAAGKTELALELARRLDGEVVSVDSALVYRGMDIGTAKPPPEIRTAVPHHLMDFLDPSESYSAGRFRSDALGLIRAITVRGRLPILVGGTMLYFHALLRGIAALPPGNPALRAEIDREAARLGWAALHGQLARVDPRAAARIHPNDPQRIQRALEVYRLTGSPLSRWWQEAGQVDLPFRPLEVVVAPKDRSVLHQRIERRFHTMLADGLVEEVERLFQRGDLHPGLPSIRSVGYRQVWGYLAGECDYATMIHKAIVATRQLAKRQFTWLRRQKDALWMESGNRGTAERVLEVAVKTQS